MTSDDSDSDDDETLELMRELEQIKKEREQQRLKKVVTVQCSAVQCSAGTG
jgi:hypothetical protein